MICCFLNMPDKTNDLHSALLVNKILKLFSNLVGFLAGLSVLFWWTKYGPLHLWKADCSWNPQVHLPNSCWELPFKSTHSRRNATQDCAKQRSSWLWHFFFFTFRFPVRGSIKRKHCERLGEALKLTATASKVGAKPQKTPKTSVASTIGSLSRCRCCGRHCTAWQLTTGPDALTHGWRPALTLDTHWSLLTAAISSMPDCIYGLWAVYFGKGVEKVKGHCTFKMFRLSLEPADAWCNKRKCIWVNIGGAIEQMCSFSLEYNIFHGGIS